MLTHLDYIRNFGAKKDTFRMYLRGGPMNRRVAKKPPRHSI